MANPKIPVKGIERLLLQNQFVIMQALDNLPGTARMGGLGTIRTQMRTTLDALDRGVRPEPNARARRKAHRATRFFAGEPGTNYPNYEES